MIAQIVATTAPQTIIPPGNEKAAETYAHQGEIGAIKWRTGPMTCSVICHQQRKAEDKGKHSDPFHDI